MFRDTKQMGARHHRTLSFILLQAGALALLGLSRVQGHELPRVSSNVPLPCEKALAFDVSVAAMLGEVQADAASALVGDLSGENEVTVGGTSHVITTRYTYSGEPIQVATQYAYDRLAAVGLDVAFHEWTEGRNVIAEQAGGTLADDVVLLVAHLDDMPATGAAPGADADASGCAGVLLAAQIMSQRSFERTIRYCLFTGTRQGLTGSSAYAELVYDAGDDVVAVVNLDMIGWDSTGDPVLRLHTRTASHPGYAGDLAIADLFVDVVNTYGLDTALTPVTDSDGMTASDHSPFWNRGFSAVLAIEDDEEDFCPYFNTSADTLDHLNLSYLTSYIKAVVGTVAHLAGPVPTIFADGFEAGDTSAWSATVP